MHLPRTMRQKATIHADPVTDFSRIEEERPETAGCTIHKLPVLSFFDDQKKAFKENLFLSGVRNIVRQNGAFFPNNRLAAVVTGSDFFDREDIITKIEKHIEKGQNLLICGPRRYGKTSIMRKIKDRSNDYGLRPIMIDLESVFTPEEFISKICVEVEWRGKTEEEKNEKAVKMEEELKDRWIEPCLSG